MNIGIIGNTSKPSALEIIGEFAEVLIKHNVSCIFWALMWARWVF